MTILGRSILFGAVAIHLIAQGAPAPAARPEAAQAAQIALLIRELGGDTFEGRVKADADLVKLGETSEAAGDRVIETLKRTIASQFQTNHPDRFEVRKRGTAIMRTLDRPTPTRVAKQVKRLYDRNPNVRAEAEAKLKEYAVRDKPLMKKALNDAMQDPQVNEAASRIWNEARLFDLSDGVPHASREGARTH